MPEANCQRSVARLRVSGLANRGNLTFMADTVPPKSRRHTFTQDSVDQDSGLDTLRTLRNPQNRDNANGGDGVRGLED